jgi:prefoldin subunit 5
MSHDDALALLRVERTKISEAIQAIETLKGKKTDEALVTLVKARPGCETYAG